MDQAGAESQLVREPSRHAPARRPVYAALDLGTNNCRLLVAECTRDGFRVIDSFSRIVRLGEGLASSGALSEPAMSRAIEALRICTGKMRRRGVTRARAVTTEACRRAANGDVFRRQVRRQMGLALEVIDESEEAALALFGCASLLDPGVPQAIVFDIGGGSTELTYIRLRPSEALADPEILGWLSVPIGVVSLAERHGGVTVSRESYEAMVAEAQGALGRFEERHALESAAAGGAIQMIGTSGTVTTLVGVQKRLPRYDRSLVDGCFLELERTLDLCSEVAGMSFEARARHPCIGHQRADLVVAGCAILEAICRLWPAPRLRVADRGLREGILLTLMAADGHRPAQQSESVQPPRRVAPRG